MPSNNQSAGTVTWSNHVGNVLTADYAKSRAAGDSIRCSPAKVDDELYAPPHMG